MTRYRERDLRIQEFGSYWDRSWDPDILVAYEERTHGLKETCEDVNGNLLGANPLQITKQFTHYPSLSGALRAWWTAEHDILREFIEFPIGHRPPAPDPAVQFGSYSLADLNMLAWKILSETNPSVPHVSVPTFVAELKDIPSLFKGWGGTLLKKVAQGHLTWRWAIAPMIRDIRKMIGFVKAVDNRMTELMSLREGRTLRRRCHLGTTKVVQSPTYVTLHSMGAGLSGWRHRTYTSEVWGSAEWKLLPNSNIPQLGYGPLENLATRLAAGITTHEALATAWELTPWSWLADWFGNVGDMVAATNNSIGCTWGRICLMRRSLGTETYELDPSWSDTWPIPNGWYVLTFERKERHPVYPVIPVPLPYLPIINGKQWSILASLAILKR